MLLLNATVSRQTDRWTKCNCSVNNKQPEMRDLRLPSFYFVCSAHFRLHSVELVSLSPATMKSRVFRCMERANGWSWPCPLLYIYIFYFSSDLYCWLLSSGHLVHHLHCWLFSQQVFLILAEQNSFHSWTSVHLRRSKSSQLRLSNSKIEMHVHWRCMCIVPLWCGPNAQMLPLVTESLFISFGKLEIKANWSSFKLIFFFFEESS